MYFLVVMQKEKTIMTNENNVTKTMEDVKHKLMWNWIIDILKYVR